MNPHDPTDNPWRSSTPSGLPGNAPMNPSIPYQSNPYPYHQESTKIEIDPGRTPSAGPVNAWDNNAPYYPSSSQQQPYQSATPVSFPQGTLGSNAYAPTSATPIPSSPLPASSTPVAHHDAPPTPTRPTNTNASQDKATSSASTSRWLLIVRFFQLIASVGHLGFAAGASSYSGVSVPFSDKSLFYFLFAVAALSILWSMFLILTTFGQCCYKLTHHQQAYENRKRWIVYAGDFIFAVLWGACTISEAAKFQCPPGDYHHFCDFYNVSIFFGIVAFLVYTLSFFRVAVDWLCRSCCCGFCTN